MTELELYKFVQGKEIEWRGKELLLWLNFFDLSEFTELIGFDYLSEGGEEVVLQHDSICIDIVCICENNEINPNNILHKKEV